MSGSADKISAHSDEDHGSRDIVTLLVVAHEAAPSCHPAEGPLDDPAAGQNLEALLVVGATDDLDHEIEVGGLVREREPA